jgi:hypothetical protein
MNSVFFTAKHDVNALPLVFIPCCQSVAALSAAICVLRNKARRFTHKHKHKPTLARVPLSTQKQRKKARKNNARERERERVRRYLRDDKTVIMQHPTTRPFHELPTHIKNLHTDPI